MTFTFRDAVREKTSLLIGLAGTSGSGKTLSALKLATGLSGGKRFAFIDTEAGRALHYADAFSFQHGELRAPFRPEAYMEAVVAADDEGYPVTVVDSTSHEWTGSGGVLEWHEEELQRMAGDDFSKRERVKMAAWIQPKRAHKRLVARMLQCRGHIIFCLRAEPKVAMVKDAKGKMQVVDKGLQPICDHQFMYEMTLSLMLDQDNPGTFAPIKLQDQHAPFFPLGQQIDAPAGEALAKWANGGKAPRRTKKASPEDTIVQEAEAQAAQGVDTFRAWWAGLPIETRRTLKPHIPALKEQAQAADADAEDIPDPFADEDVGQTLSNGQAALTKTIERRIDEATDQKALEVMWAENTQDMETLPKEAYEYLSARYDERMKEIVT